MQCVTADLVDRHPESVSSCAVQFQQYGGLRSFCGPIRTVKTLEDNAIIKDLLASPGGGAVLIVDGAGSLRTALAGDLIAGAAAHNGWAGLIIFGAVRDCVQLRDLPIGIKAIGTNPMKSGKLGSGTIDMPVNFGGVMFKPGQWIYSDEDGILVAPAELDE